MSKHTYKIELGVAFQDGTWDQLSVIGKHPLAVEKLPDYQLPDALHEWAQGTILGALEAEGDGRSVAGTFLMYWGVVEKEAI